MSRFFQRSLWAWLTVGAGYSLQAFSLMGPFDTWQTSELTYEPPLIRYVDIGGPQNLGEEYRWTVPVVTYGFDSSFLNYFGADGVKAVDKAFDILNKLPPVSTLSSNLIEFPLEGVKRVNHRASAVGLLDVKSFTLGVLLEELGLANAERFTWTLHARRVIQNIPFYVVVQRNFDPITLRPSSYVNGKLYTYQIVQNSNPDFWDSEEQSVDPYFSFSSVASYLGSQFQFYGLSFGEFYTGLTRDDVGGLRYLLNPNHVHVETPLGDTQLEMPDTSALVLLTNLDLALFTSRSKTNPPAVMRGNYPGLTITKTNISVTNMVLAASTYVTNLPPSPWDPPGSIGTFAVVTNYVTNLIAIYDYKYATNFVTNYFGPTSQLTLQTVDIRPSPFGPPFPPLLVTNTNSVTVESAIPSGGFFIIDTNSAVAGYQFITNFDGSFFALTNIITTTNVVAATSNILTGAQFQEQVVSYFTNVIYATYAINLTNANPGLQKGVDKITFKKVQFDSLVGTNLNVFVTNFTLVTITNSTAYPQKYRRTITQPDIQFSAQDFGVGPNGEVNALARSLAANWQNNNGLNASANLNGPGQIQPQIQITFSKVGTFKRNSGSFLTESSFTGFLWGSFDGTTNAPVVFPIGTSIQTLEQQVLGGP